MRYLQSNGYAIVKLKVVKIKTYFVNVIIVNDERKLRKY